MANICDNYVKVSGPREAARGFLDKFKEGGFNAFIPQPPITIDDDTMRWAVEDWREKSWGDKWNIDHYDNNFDLDYLKTHFITAYTPPTAWFLHVAKEYPMLTLELHYESGCQEFGWLKAEAGVFTTAYEESLADEQDDDDDSAFQRMMSLASDWYFADSPANPSGQRAAGHEESATI